MLIDLYYFYFSKKYAKHFFSAANNSTTTAGVNLPNTLIFDYPTISAIADFTSSQMGPGPAPAGRLNDQLFRCVSKNQWHGI